MKFYSTVRQNFPLTNFTVTKSDLPLNRDDFIVLPGSILHFLEKTMLLATRDQKKRATVYTTFHFGEIVFWFF